VSEGQGPPPGHAVAGLAARIGTLGRRVDGVDQRLGGLERQVGETVTMVVELVEQEEAATRAERAVWWLELPPEEKPQALRELVGWVDEILRDCYPEFIKDLGTCWYRHRDIVQELIALRSAWFTAYQDKSASTTAAIEWHDRWFPGAMARCKAAIKARGCKSGHEEPPRTAALQGSQDFKAFLESLAV